LTYFFANPPSSQEDLSLCDRPLCIDLDGTLIQGNSLWKLLKTTQWHSDFLRCRTWSSLKKTITQNSTLNPHGFTYYTPLVQALTRWHKQGIPLFLVTGASEKLAVKIAHHLGCFTDVWSSTGHIHLVGSKKADLLKSKFGAFGFTYIGDSWKDLPVWKYSYDIGTVSNCAHFLVPYLRIWKHSSQKLVIF